MITAHRIKLPAIEVPQPPAYVAVPDEIGLVLSQGEARTLWALSRWAGTASASLDKALKAYGNGSINVMETTVVLDRINTAMGGVFDR